MITREKLYTAEEFLELARLPENEGRRLELEDGVIIEMPPSRPIKTIVASRINYFLSAHVLPNDLGFVTTTDGGYKLATGRVRQPDVGFVSKARYATPPDEFEGGPDIAVEVVSPNEDVLKKAYEYLESGTTLVWAIYPDEQRVHILRAGTQWQVLNSQDTLTGETVLPNFKLPVRDIFPATD